MYKRVFSLKRKDRAVCDSGAQINENRTDKNEGEKINKNKNIFRGAVSSVSCKQFRFRNGPITSDFTPGTLRTALTFHRFVMMEPDSDEATASVTICDAMMFRQCPGHTNQCPKLARNAVHVDGFQRRRYRPDDSTLR